MISTRTIAQALVNMGKTADPEKVAREFIAFVQKYKLEGLVGAILSHVQELKDAEKKENTIRIRSSHTLSEKNIVNIEQMLNASPRATREIHIEPELIGGFVAYWKDSRVDASIEGTLQTLEHALLT